LFNRPDVDVFPHPVRTFAIVSLHQQLPLDIPKATLASNVGIAAQGAQAPRSSNVAVVILALLATRKKANTEECGGKKAESNPLILI